MTTGSNLVRSVNSDPLEGSVVITMAIWFAGWRTRRTNAEVAIWAHRVNALRGLEALFITALFPFAYHAPRAIKPSCPPLENSSYG